MTSSNGNIFRVTDPLCGNSPVPVNSPHKGQWRGALMFSLICAWINRWVNNREAGDLRRYRAHYDVVVMIYTVGVRSVLLYFKMIIKPVARIRQYTSIVFLMCPVKSFILKFKSNVILKLSYITHGTPPLTWVNLNPSMSIKSHAR